MSVISKNEIYSQDFDLQVLISKAPPMPLTESDQAITQLAIKDLENKTILASLDGIPDDLKVSILKYCELSDFYNLSNVSKQWKALKSNKQLMDSLHHKIAEAIDCPIQPGEDTQKQYERYILELVQTATKINDRPTDITQLLEKIKLLKTDLIVDQVNYLQSWLKARDTIVAWQGLATSLLLCLGTDKTESLLSSGAPFSANGQLRFGFKTSKEMIDTAETFKVWFNTHKKYLQKVTSLYLSEKQLSTLPEEIGQLTALENLYLNTNRFSKFPAQICKLRNLKSLNFNYNQLCSLPETFRQLGKLKSVEFEGNQFYFFPDEINFKGSSLKVINFKKNRLISISHLISNLKKLQRLDLSNNSLISVPSQLSKLPELRYLNLSDNQLTSLPNELYELRLSNLYLHNNRLLTRPTQFKEIPARFSFVETDYNEEFDDLDSFMMN